MGRNKYEEKYLIAMLSAVINQKSVPVPGRGIIWEDVFKMAEFHHVANVVYYGLLGLDEDIPKIWRTRFFDKYRESVLQSERLLEAERSILKVLERHHIHSVLLNGSAISDCYPFKEMRFSDSINIMVEANDMADIDRLMYKMNFEEKESRVYKGTIYYKIPGIKVIFYTGPTFVSRKMQRYFRLIFRDLPMNPDYEGYIHQLNQDDFYVYQMCSLVDGYATGEIELRSMLDLWLYYQKYHNDINWFYVVRAMNRMKVGGFGERLEKLNLLWFGGSNTEEPEIYDAMEEYIITKGVEGREVSSRLLPLIKVVADFYERDRRKEQFYKTLSWMFPKRDYMEVLYPVLEKASILLPLFWLIRLIRTTWSLIKSKMKASEPYISLTTGIKKVFGKLKPILKKITPHSKKESKEKPETQ